MRTQKQIMIYSISALGGVVLILCAILVGISVHRSSSAQEVALVSMPEVSQPKPAIGKFTVDATKLKARAAIVYDATTGEVLYEKNAELPLPLASLTKLMTLYTAATILETKNAQTTFPITIASSDLMPEGSWGFAPGQQFSFQDLADATIVASANDAAHAIARGTYGSVPTFVEEMNRVAQRLGLTSAKFDNPSGLDANSSTAGGYASAHDVARLVSSALTEYPDVFAASRDAEIKIRDAANTVTLDLANTNQNVTETHGIRISKTGYTDLAGGNLAIGFDAGLNQPVVIVVLGSTQEGRFADVATLTQAVSTEMARLAAANQ